MNKRASIFEESVLRCPSEVGIVCFVVFEGFEVNGDTENVAEHLATFVVIGKFNGVGDSTHPLVSCDVDFSEEFEGFFESESTSMNTWSQGPVPSIPSWLSPADWVSSPSLHIQLTLVEQLDCELLMLAK